jgi:hypothetical protein
MVPVSRLPCTKSVLQFPCWYSNLVNLNSCFSSNFRCVFHCPSFYCAQHKNTRTLEDQMEHMYLEYPLTYLWQHAIEWILLCALYGMEQTESWWYVECGSHVFIFSKASKLALQVNKPSTQWLLDSLPWHQAAKVWRLITLPESAKVKSVWNYNSTHTYTLISLCLNFIFMGPCIVNKM